MKIFKCDSCNRTQKEGKFCLDCGNKLTEIITAEVNFKSIKTKRTSEQLKRDIRNWLARIGVQQNEIKISSGGERSEVEYVLNKTMYCFSSHLQNNITNNLAAVEQFLHYRVLGIERGIESVEQAFKGYESLPDPTSNDPYDILNLNKDATLEEAKSRFKHLSKQYHPDVNKSKNANEEFNRIKKAMKAIEAGG